jgi:hypothetical protein
VVCVTDANIWIDLHHANLLDEAFELEVTWMTPDIVFHDEVLTVDRPLLKDLGLQIRSLTGKELNRITELSARHPSPSPKDLSTIVVAKVEDGIVVTGDGPLRTAVEREEMEVHGVLWVLDQLVDQTIISSSRAATALNTMVSRGSRLPKAEVQQRLRSWRES